jgi:hypothetical protein
LGLDVWAIYREVFTGQKPAHPDMLRQRCEEFTDDVAI